MTSSFNRIYSHNGERQEKISDLGFLVKVENIDLELYPRQGTPKDYITTLSIFEKGRETERKNIEVNHPLTYKGLTFYQSGYGIIFPEAVILKLVKKFGQKEIITNVIPVNTSYKISGTAWELRPINFYPDFGIKGDRIINYSDTPDNPALELELWENGRKLNNFFILSRHLDIQPNGLPYNIYLEKLRAKEYTVLQVTRDPGVYFVYFGCILIVFGIILSFYFAHQRIWGVIDDKNLYLGGLTSKNKFIFQKEFEKIAKRIEVNG